MSNIKSSMRNGKTNTSNYKSGTSINKLNIGCIEFKDVTFSYGKSGKNAILRHFTTSFDASRITVLAGPSGSGKSTVLYLAAGIYPQNAGVLHSGKILVDGQEIGTMPPEKRCALVGLMFQNPDLQFCMDTVENEIYFCLGNICAPRGEMEEITRYALEFCGITHLRKRLLLTLSGGEKQKAMLACLVALRPKWLLLDEPFANIDEATAADLVQKISALHRNGTGILVVDHRLDHWLPVADEIRFINTETGISETGYSPKNITQEILINNGLLPPGMRYRQTRESESPGAFEKGVVVSKAESFFESAAERTAEAIAETVLELKELTVKHDGKHVLDKISYKFQKGKVYAVTGVSGSGKSTLFGAVQGLYPYEGEILLKGKNIRKRRSLKPGSIGFVMQNPQDQFVADTVQQEIEISLKHKKGKYLHAKEDKSIHNDVESILRDIHLWKYRNFSPFMLSQGQQRRLGVAALLSYECEVLLCDEPTYAQDWNNTVAIMDALTDKTKEMGMTLIFSTHDTKLAEDYADIILYLEGGKLYEKNKPGL